MALILIKQKMTFVKLTSNCIARTLQQSNKLSSQSGVAKKTCLYDFHVSHGGKMVDFAGWNMPVQYNDQTIIESHLHTRQHVSIFDVSHMLQTHVHGKDRLEFIESLVVGDIASLKDNQGTLTVFTNDNGGIIDDLIVNKTSLGHLYVVSNAGCADKDLSHMQTRAAEFKTKGKDVVLEVIHNGLLAVQGPEMSAALQAGININLKDLYFMNTTLAKVFDVPNCRVSRCGYTGEDGVEISVAEDKAAYITQRLLESKSASVKLAGLGARDSLRLEAGLCLYGNDIDDKTTPIEAQLAWTIGKRRRQERNFSGAKVILQQLRDKPLKKRVGFISSGAPARGHTIIFDASGSKEVGHLTSGCPSPSLKKNISMGYIESEYSANGTKVKLEVRKKLYDAELVKMPFVPTRYYNVK